MYVIMHESCTCNDTIHAVKIVVYRIEILLGVAIGCCNTYR